MDTLSSSEYKDILRVYLCQPQYYMENIFAEIIVPLPIRDTYTFSVPPHLAHIQPGHRVEVQFGRKKRYTGIVHHLHQKNDRNLQVKPILDILDAEPLISKLQLDFWGQLTEYYLCTLGEVMNVALPAGIKLSSETNFIFNESFADRLDELTGDAALLAEALSHQKELSYYTVQDLLGKKSIQPIIQALLHLGVMLLKEELKQTYKPKTQKFIVPLFVADNEGLEQVFEKVKNAPKQTEVVLALLQWIKSDTAVSTAMLNEKIPDSAAALKSMEKKGLLSLEERQVSRADSLEGWNAAKMQLSPVQEIAVAQIKGGFEEQGIVLLHGVTGSGKTLVYIRLIEEALAAGGQVLYMVPEIALTTQLMQRIQNYFGDSAGVYHSGVGSDYKVDLWDSVRKGKSLVISARSGIFLPFKNLRLIIIDEEHEYSYKQNDPAPRYHIREASIMLSRLYGAKILFGSATPSMESYFNALRGRYALVQLTERYGDAALPKVRLIDRRLAENSKPKGSHFSPALLHEMMTTLMNRKQVIIFQNRRGFSPVLTCKLCGWTKQCINCDVSMPYHKYNHSFMCHYCGWSDPADPACPACGNVDLEHIGFGTEKIEEELRILFPEAEIARMDLDTVRGKRALADMIFRLETGQIDILVGTQLVSKGLDFENVELVGIISADQLTRYPDFRTGERAFQMMVQVSGRSGRTSNQGKVYIQYEKIPARMLEQVKQADYASFYNETLEERYKFKYPPYCRLIGVTIRHRHPDIARNGAEFLAAQLRDKWGSRIIGPAPGLISRIRNYYIFEILIKMERRLAIITELKNDLQAARLRTLADPALKSLSISIDVDPL